MLDGQHLHEPSPHEVILLVDDDVRVLSLLSAGLQRLGYVVLAARNGEEALEVLQEYHAPTSVVITDIMMPAMNGVELAAMLHDWYPALRFLFISGYVRPDVSLTAALQGGSKFLAKPFTIHELAIAVRQLIDAPVTGLAHGSGPA